MDNKTIKEMDNKTIKEMDNTIKIDRVNKNI